jgi:tetratricopeptide (TPR) repeat protein
MPRARDAAARAAALGDAPAARLVLGTVALRYDWDWTAAERHLARALVLDPASAPAHLEMADLLLVRGDIKGALREADRAEQLDPVCPVVRGQVAGSYYAARRFPEAVEAWRRSAAVAPALVGPHERLFHAYRHSARGPEAIAEAVQVLAILGAPGSGPLLAAPPADGIASFVRGTIAYLERDAARSPALVADRIAVLHSALGHREDALRWLAIAARERSTTLPVTLMTDPDLDPLRDDPAFRALRARLTRS